MRGSTDCLDSKRKEWNEIESGRFEIPLFEAQWPGHQAVFIFDNATNHTAFAPDALCVANMNLEAR